MHNKIKTVQELRPILDILRAAGEKIVFTNGCFDLIHTGHTRYLAKAKSLGNILVVGVNSDASVRMIKGNKRPINAETDRMEVLAALESVNFVVLFHEKNWILIASFPNFSLMCWSREEIGRSTRSSVAI